MHSAQILAILPIISAVSAAAVSNNYHTNAVVEQPSACGDAAPVNTMPAQPEHAGEWSHTTPDEPTKTNGQTGVTHTVAAGRGGLHFDPENIVAEIGDIIEWHFLPKNHSVAQSSFDKPCQPIDGQESFNAGFHFNVMEGQASDVFQVTVQDKKPIWFYCPQPNGTHCQKGMVGVINQNFDGDKTLAAHKELAAKVHPSDAAAAAAAAPIAPHGGHVLANPNPQSGL